MPHTRRTAFRDLANPNRPGDMFSLAAVFEELLDALDREDESRAIEQQGRLAVHGFIVRWRSRRPRRRADGPNGRLTQFCLFVCALDAGRLASAVEHQDALKAFGLAVTFRRPRIRVASGVSGVEMG